MLTLTRKPGETIHIGDDIIIEVVCISGSNRVRIGITAPRELPIHRSEVYLAIRAKLDNQEEGESC